MSEGENQCIIVPNDYPKLPLERFTIPKAYEDCLSHVMLPESVIQERIKQMAIHLVDNYTTEPKSPHLLTLLCVLKGAFRFFSDLFNEMVAVIGTKRSTLLLELSFVRIQSYINDASANEPLITGLHDPAEFKDKDILVIEDLIDTGRSMRALLTQLDALHPRRVRVASLLLKRIPTGIQYRPDYVGFEIPAEFVVGYALDYNEYFRDLPHLCIINQHGREKYRVNSEPCGRGL
ncbi:unnamed protein product [Dicrocoelium dendriticum]|nr:unnamed protein product [Dicrocoelium dendriticum]